MNFYNIPDTMTKEEANSYIDKNTVILSEETPLLDIISFSGSIVITTVFTSLIDENTVKMVVKSNYNTGFTTKFSEILSHENFQEKLKIVKRVMINNFRFCWDENPVVTHKDLRGMSFNDQIEWFQDHQEDWNIKESKIVENG